MCVCVLDRERENIKEALFYQIELKGENEREKFERKMRQMRLEVMTEHKEFMLFNE